MDNDSPYDRKGFEWVFARWIVAVPVSMALCSACGGLSVCALPIVKGFFSTAHANLAMSAMFVWAFAGGVLSPACMFVTTSRDAIKGTKAVALAAGVASVLSGLVGVVLIWPPVYVAACIWWRLSNGGGRSTLRAGYCAMCGYNLAGLEASMCPECGHQHVSGVYGVQSASAVQGTSP